MTASRSTANKLCFCPLFHVLRIGSLLRSPVLLLIRMARCYVWGGRAALFQRPEKPESPWYPFLFLHPSHIDRASIFQAQMNGRAEREHTITFWLPPRSSWD